MREATDSEKGFTDAPNVWYDGKFGRVKCLIRLSYVRRKKTSDALNYYQ